MLNLIQTINAHKGKGWAVDWSPHDDRLASCGDDKTACIYSTENLKKEKCQSEPLPLITKIGDNHTRSIRDVSWSPCGRYLLLASFDGQVTLWEQSKGKKFSCVSVVEGHENEVKSVAWASSGRYFASCGRDKNVMIWSLIDDGEDVECSGVMTVHTQDVKHVVWHPQLEVLASCSYDDTIKMYANDIDDGDWSTTTTLTGHESTVWAIDFDSSGNRLVSCSDDRTVKIWERSVDDEDKSNTWTCVATASGHHTRPIYHVSWNHKNGLIATACGDDYIRIFNECQVTEGVDRSSLELVCKIKGHNSDVNCVKWHPTLEYYLASTGDDGCVKIWEFQEFE